MTSFVYRVEDGSKHGPYTSKRSPKLTNLLNKHQKGDRHPGAVKDMSFQRWGETLWCACESPDKLMHWFNDVRIRRELSRCGYMIVRYEVKHVRRSKSGKQCSFYPSDVISRTILFK